MGIRTLLFVISVPVLFSCTAVENAITPLFLSDEDEVNLGDKFKAEILADSINYPLYKNTNANRSAVINYVTTMGNAIALKQDRKSISYTFTLIKNDTMINAFAVPGGHVFVYTGLLKVAQSGAEVAGVLAHEVGHVAMRHGAKQLVAANGVSFLTQLLVGDSSSAAGKIANICAGLLFLKFSRDDEYQADSCSVAYTSAAGYNPKGIADFFQTLIAKYGDGMGPFEVMSTHPNTSDRISGVRRIIAKTAGAPRDDTTGMYTKEYAEIKSKI